MMDTNGSMGLNWSMMISCACGCGRELEDKDVRGRSRSFILGHCKNRLGTKHTPEAKAKIKQARAKQTITDKTKALWSKNRRGSGNSAWKGGRYSMSSGYILLWNPEHPNSNKDGYIFEHRLVMEQSIGRYLLNTEVVHHKNRIRYDNRIENLELFASHSEHMKIGHARA